MRNFAQATQRMNAAVFDALGDDATWQGIASVVAVRIARRDIDQRLDLSEVRERSTIITVRAVVVAAPQENDMVSVLTGQHAGNYRITGQPELLENGIWRCAAVAAA